MSTSDDLATEGFQFEGEGLDKLWLSARHRVDQKKTHRHRSVTIPSFTSIQILGQMDRFGMESVSHLQGEKK